MLTKPVRPLPSLSHPRRYASHGFAVSALYLYFFVIALNTVVWWMLTFPRTIRNVRIILVVNAFISAFYGLFPMVYLFAANLPQFMQSEAPYTGVDILQKLPDSMRPFIFIDESKAALLGGTPGDVVWKVRQHPDRACPLN